MIKTSNTNKAFIHNIDMTYAASSVSSPQEQEDLPLPVLTMYELRSTLEALNIEILQVVVNIMGNLNKLN